MAVTSGESIKITDRPNMARPARNVLANWATYFASGAVSFFLTPFIVRHLGNSAYGVWTLLVSMTGYLGFLDLGIRGAVTRYVAKFHSESDHEKSSQTVSSSLWPFFCGLGALAILVAVIFAIFVIPHFKIPPSPIKKAAQSGCGHCWGECRRFTD